MLNIVGINPAPVLVVIKDLSCWCLVTAIAAPGMKTSLKAMADVGGRAIALIVAETVFLTILALSRWQSSCGRRKRYNNTIRLATRDSCHTKMG